jgi:response regulator RpfG family c-di-GMP phosphodiesterase/tRNA A-37 threonylcarbamoyl transferase component Bud32
MPQLVTTPSPIAGARRSAESGGAPAIDKFLANSFVLLEDWERLPLRIQESILLSTNQSGMLNLLVENALLTEYQAGRITAGTTFGLVLGNYRILDRIGAGGMAVVFRAEHVDLRHTVAIKVLPSSPGQDSRLEHRFFSEMRTVSQLRHPNIVAAFDAGRVDHPDPNGTSFRYLVMEYVPGKDLEEYVLCSGPLPIGRACSVIYQVASALAETNKLKLVHRDIKPSNIMITAEEQAKLLDFGLSRHFQTRLTSPGAVLGTVDFMAPEQARDASTVDIRADIYSLGGALFWALTGRLPFPQLGGPIESLARRLTAPAPSLGEALPNCPAELDRIVARMMSLVPADRFQTPQEVMQALIGFICVDSPEYQRPTGLFQTRSSSDISVSTTRSRVLVVDDERGICDFAQHLLSMLDLHCDLAENGEEALAAVSSYDYDLVLLDLFMPGMTGREVLRRLRDDQKRPNLKIILLSGQASPDQMSQLLEDGADDFLAKPFSPMQLQGRVRAALRLKSAQDRSIHLTQELATVRDQLGKNLQTSDQFLATTRRALVMGLSRLVELRDARGPRHLNRMQRYCRTLAQAASEMPSFADHIDDAFVAALECCVPLYDVGKAGLPDHLLTKAGILSNQERMLMQTHTTFAAETLHDVAREYPAAGAFLRMVIDVIRHHHERFDGSGYPDRLSGESIPLAARIVTICDVYDALRSHRIHRPALSHGAALKIIQTGSPGQFDPRLLGAFERVADEFNVIYVGEPN